VVDEVFCRVHFSRFVLKERDCSLHHAPESRAAPDETHPAGARARRAAEPQQPSDSRRKPENFLRLLARGCGGATRDARAGLNTTEDLIAGCLLSGNAPTEGGCRLLDYNGSVRDDARNFGGELGQQKWQQKCQQRRFG